MPDLMSRPYQPDPSQCCEACVFHSGTHAEFCPWFEARQITDELVEALGLSPKPHWKRDRYMRTWLVPRGELTVSSPA